MSFYTDVKKTLDNIVKKQKDNMIIRWKGLIEIQNLYLIYLLNKYKSKCLFKTTGLEFNIERKQKSFRILEFFGLKKTRENTILHKLCDELVDCIKNKDIETMIIPLALFFVDKGHANVLIYRKRMSVIEHFEPKGNNVMDQDIIDSKINLMDCQYDSQYVYILQKPS
jgi:hypothetical protein